MSVFRNKRTGFTLIELLVVVSIIALLVSILLPALSRARDSAKRSVCASGLRQIAIIQTGYSLDWESWIPRYTYNSAVNQPNHASNVRVWPGTMLAEPLDYCRSTLGMNDAIWVCPSFEGRNSDAIGWEAGMEGERLAMSGGSGQWPSGYWGIGVISLVGLVPSSGVEPRVGVRDSALKVTDPGYYLLAADKNFRSMNDWEYEGSPGGAPASMMAHVSRSTGLPSGANLAHVDGSVNWNGAEQMALDGRTLGEELPDTIDISSTYAEGKYDQWPTSGREYYW